MFQVGKYTVHLSKDDVMCKPTDLWEDMGMEFQHIPKISQNNCLRASLAHLKPQSVCDFRLKSHRKVLRMDLL